MPTGLDASRWASHTNTPPKPDPYRINRRRPRRSQPARLPTPIPTPISTPSAGSVNQSEPIPTHDGSTTDSGFEPEQEFFRFLKIVARLNWKMPFLKQGYHFAIESDDGQRRDAEIQFKLDFHEFYMLIERALVRLMAIFGIEVTGNGITINGDLLISNGSDGSDTQDADERPRKHSYHANVLAALENPRNPLNSVFGAPEVRQQLLRAKDLRNRWKNIDEADPKMFSPAPLSSYNLELILQTIFTAIEQAHILAVQYIEENRGKPMNVSDEPTEEKDWEFMVDAMDWQAV